MESQFSRTALLLGDEAIDKLRKCRVAVFGVGGVLTAVCFCITLIWGFDVRQLFGFGIGYGFMCLQFWYFGYCCENAVTMDRKGAVRSMRVCYAVRMAAMVILSCGAAYTGFVNFTGILIPQLFPKIILTADHFIGRKG